MSTEKKSLIGTLLAALASLFHKAKPIVDEIAGWANDLTNVIKHFEASQAGQLIETGIETVFPASTNLINAFRLWLPKVGAIIANVQDFENLSDEQKLEAFLKYLSFIKTSDPVLYAGLLNTLQASIQQFFAQNKGVTDLNVQLSLSSAQLAYDKTLGGVLTEV